MTRTVPEWRGATDDAPIPPRVRLRVFQKFDGNCASCTRTLFPGHWACDHIIALANGGKHAESNLQPLCDVPCHAAKTGADVAEKSRVYRKAAKHAGIKLRHGPKIQSRGFAKREPQRTASRPIVRHSQS